MSQKCRKINLGHLRYEFQSNYVNMLGKLKEMSILFMASSTVTNGLDPRDIYMEDDHLNNLYYDYVNDIMSGGVDVINDYALNLSDMERDVFIDLGVNMDDFFTTSVVPGFLNSVNITLDSTFHYTFYVKNIKEIGRDQFIPSRDNYKSIGI